jgi:hypothetical protein
MDGSSKWATLCMATALLMPPLMATNRFVMPFLACRLWMKSLKPFIATTPLSPLPTTAALAGPSSIKDLTARGTDGEIQNVQYCALAPSVTPFIQPGSECFM